MNTLPLATLATALLILATPYSQPVSAGPALQRCVTAEGTVLYTDKACGALGATATPISSEFKARLARDAVTSDALADAGTAITSVGRRSLSGGCARTPTQLSMDLRGAFALGDVNRIAESYHWTGLSSKEGHRIMERLDQLSGRRISDVHYFNAQIQSPGLGNYEVASVSNSFGSAGVMQVTFGNDASTSVTDFDVEKYSGCYFVRF